MLLALRSTSCMSSWAPLAGKTDPPRLPLCSGEWVPAPGGTASAKWMAWHMKNQADGAMRGGEVPSGVVLE